MRHPHIPALPLHGLGTPKDWSQASEPFGFNWILNRVVGAGTGLLLGGSDLRDSGVGPLIAQGHPANCMAGPWVHGSLSLLLLSHGSGPS